MLKPRLLADDDLALIREFIPGNEPALAPCGSGPRKSKVYSVAETRLAGNEREYLNRCIDSNWVSSKGPFVHEFEEVFARHAGCEFGVACSSGTAALHLVLAALGIGPGDEVIIPTFTMIATANAVRYTGAKVALVDSEPDYLNIDVNLVEAAITSRTKAILVVHTYGHPAQMQRLQKIARERDLHLIEDAAEAHGAEIHGQRAGSFGLVAAFSFYANKIVTTGEGGMVTTNDRKLADLIRRLSQHAFHPERHFWHEYVGFNYRMTNLQAAIGLAQCERIDEMIAARRRVRSWYERNLQSCIGLRLPAEAKGCKCVFWMYAIRVNSAFGCTSHELRQELAQRGIETRSFFIPMHFQPIYFDQFRGRRFPVAEALGQSGLYLPTHENLKQRDIKWIAQQIEEIHRQRKGRNSEAGH
jgi:perosamine synthetase